MLINRIRCNVFASFTEDEGHKNFNAELRDVLESLAQPSGQGNKGGKKPAGGKPQAPNKGATSTRPGQGARAKGLKFGGNRGAKGKGKGSKRKLPADPEPQDPTGGSGSGDPGPTPSKKTKGKGNGGRTPLDPPEPNINDPFIA
jgi:hypothetical protein